LLDEITAVLLVFQWVTAMAGKLGYCLEFLLVDMWEKRLAGK